MTSLPALASSVPALPATATGIIQMIDGQPMISSKDLAVLFQKKHKHVLGEIERLRSFLPAAVNGPNFRPISIPTDLGHATRQDKAYLLSEQAFYVISTGFTGKAATLRRWELVAAFLFFKDAYYEQQAEVARLEAEADREALAAQVIESRQAVLALETSVEQARREGREIGRKEVLATRRRDTPVYRALIRRALRYKGMGLGCREISKLMDCSHQKIFFMLKDAAVLGLGV
jgi:phage regulator Rha-like protein